MGATCWRCFRCSSLKFGNFRWIVYRIFGLVRRYELLALCFIAICYLFGVLVAVSIAMPEAESYDDETLVWNKANAVPMSNSTRLLTFLLVLCVVTLWVVF